jgi:RNA 2',3'-cyclic 3'-phosphodiesterase
MRSFIAIPVPDEIGRALAPVQAALPFGRSVAPENLHLTLAFLGEVSEAMLEEVHFALETLRHPGFEITLAGLDIFGGDRPTTFNIAAQANAGLSDLQKRIRSRLHGIGLEIERRRFSPHVTLARFPKSMTPDETGRIGRFLAGRADLRLPPYRADAFCLYESILTADGAHYEVLASYPLAPAL